MQETFKQEEAGSKDKTLPRSLFKGKFNLTEEQFMAGLSDREFTEVWDSDRQIHVYSWNSKVHSQSRGKSEGTVGVY